MLAGRVWGTDNMAEHDINGQWRGFYSYQKWPDAGSGFDADFYESKGTLEGSITDHDMLLGEASLSGSFNFPSVKFVKVYMHAHKVPINYEGTMSDDGKSMSGKWTIVELSGDTSTGFWSAHRLDEEKKDRAIETDRVKDREVEKVQ